MYPLDDDNLDHLSREAAELFEVEAGASGWDHLEQRLNKELPQEKKRRRFLFWLFLISATTGGALIAILHYQPVTPLAKNATSAVTRVHTSTAVPGSQTANNHTTNTTRAESVSGNNNNEAPVSKAPETGQLPAGNTQPSTGATGNATPYNPVHKPGVNEPAAAPAVNAPNKTVTGTAEKPPTATKGGKPAHARIRKTPATLNYVMADKQMGYPPVQQHNHPLRTGTKKKNTAGVVNEPGDELTTQPQPAGNEPDKAVSTDNTPATTGQAVETTPEVATVPPTATQPTDSLKNKPAVTQAADSANSMAKQKKKNDKIKQPLEFGLMTGPDMSAVAFGPLYKTGYNFGIQLGYRFSEHWSVNVGAIYTKKFYKTDSSHFEYKGTPWPPNKKVSRVEGNCSMWDIPVNVRYDFSFNNKRRWFASTGLSTYLMDKEDYDIYYRWNGGPTYSQPWPSDSNSTYLFSIWNLSAGMERSLGKRFSLQAEPYLKVPLRDLGKGNIRMNSYGILFTLKYKPFLQSKRSDNNK